MKLLLQANVVFLFTLLGQEWYRLMWGVRELWGPSQVLRKAHRAQSEAFRRQAVVAVGPENRSLLAHVALAKDRGIAQHAALFMLLQAFKRSWKQC